MPELTNERASKACGTLWQIDANGFILNDAELGKIGEIYTAAVSAVVETYRAQAGSSLHSIYLRGTVPRGMVVPGISDLDTFGVLQNSADIEIIRWPENAKTNILTKCHQLTGVQLELFSVSDALKADEVHELPFVIKTQSVCLYGDDLSSQLPNYRPDAAVANIDIVQIEADLDEAIAHLSSAQSNAIDLRHWCARIMKNILRTGFSLTMVSEKIFTRDLMICAETFGRHYPAQSEDMNQALRYVFDPEPDQAELMSFLSDFGNWINHEAEIWLAMHNPDKSNGIRLLCSPPVR